MTDGESARAAVAQVASADAVVAIPSAGRMSA
jgi:hypothetical protein